jgi:hypothetical protein
MWAQLAPLIGADRSAARPADQHAGGHGREPQVSKSWRGPYLEETDRLTHSLTSRAANEAGTAGSRPSSRH